MPATPTFPEKLPKTLAAWLQDTPPSLPPQRPVALAAGKGLQTRWEWSLRAQGGAPLDAQGGITESVWVGTIPELLSRFMDWLNAATLCHWVPVNGAAAAHGHALLADAGTLEHEPAEERDPVVSTNTREAALPPSFARRDPPCGRCGHADVAAVSLQESMLREIWEVPACKICLACGDVQPLKALDTASARSSAINGDDVMEVSTTAILRLRGSRANEVERLISRTLRVEPGQVSVAAPRNACHGEPTEAKHRVAHISMSSRGAGVATAAAVAKMHRQGGSLMNDGPFSQDQEWVHSCLHDTGLDLIYGDTRPIKVDIAIEELDDRRMLPRRQEVHPLILWAELRHVLGPELNLVTWIHACFAITNGGKFSLPAAIMIKRNIESLRVVTGMVRASTGPERDVPLPAVWPLALHRVLLAREGAAEAVLGRALARAGIESGSGAALCAEGARVLRSLHDRSSKCSSREPGEASTPGAVAGGKNILDEATSVMRELAYRRLHSDAQGHGAAAFRATLRARRQLRQIQVSKYLTGLTQKIFQNDTNWRRRSNGSESVSSVFSEPEEGAAEEEDLGEEGGSEEEMGVESKEAQEEEERRRAAAELAAEEEARHGEELTVQKVLGHAREYVHIRDILQKALEVLFVIVQTFSRFSACIDNASLAKRKSTAMPRLARNLERVLVEQGFVRTALRAVYRHHHRPEICGHALSLLAHLLDGNAMHGCGPRVAAELSEPPERFLTLAAGAGNLSNGGHLGPLRTCLKVLNAVVWPQSEDAAFREPPPMPSGREAEAAEALVGILDRNPDEEDIYIQALHLLSGLVHNSPMCIALIRRGLAETLRRWLSRCAGGAVQEAWRKAARRKSGSQVGPSGRGARALKQMNHALSGIRASVFRSEEIAWDLAANLARGGAGEPNFLEDTRLSVEQALGELRRDPRGSQWAYAVNFLTKLLAFEREMKFSDRAFSAAVLAGGGMQLLRAEFPDGEVPTALPLLREVVCAAGRAPRPPRGHLDVDEQPEDSDVPSNAEALESAASLQSTASLPSVTTTAAEAKDWLVRHQGVNWLLEAMHKHTKADIHCGLLRIMGELFEAGQPVSSLAATTFRDYRGRKGVSLSNILKAMRKSFHSVELVDAALHTLHGVLAVDKQLAIVLGNLGDGCPCLVDVVWGNLGHRRLRVRALALLKTVCEAVPEKTERIAAIWQEKSQPHGVCRGPSAPPEETGEQDGAASPHGREGSGSASNGGSASSAEEQAEEAYRSVEEAGSNTEEASSSAVDDEVEAGSSTAEADVEVGSNAELPPTGKATADPVPRDVQRFGALLTVHQYDRSKGQGSVQDVMKAMREFDGNQEICALGLASMLKGANMDVKKRITALLEAPFNFSNTMRRIVVHFPITAIVLDAMRLLTGILLTKPEHPNEYVEVLALAASTLLEVPPQWTAAEWEVLILAFETVNGHVLGRTALAQFELHSRTAEEWEKFMHKEDEASRTIVRKYKGETERTLGIYR